MSDSRPSHACAALRETVGGVFVDDLLVLEVPELADVRRARCLFCPGCGERLVVCCGGRVVVAMGDQIVLHDQGCAEAGA